MGVVIIGNGIVGVTTAVELRKNDPKTKITLISGETPYHYSRPALMYIYMRDMKLKHTQPYENFFWKEQDIKLVYDWAIDFNFKEKVISLKKSPSIRYEKLVLAIGSKGNRYGWPGENLPGVLNFTNLQELEELEKRTKKNDKNFRVLIAGGGLIGIEVAEMMAHRKIPTTFLVREETYWPSALSSNEGRLIEKEIVEHGIDLKTKTEISKILANEKGEVGSVLTKGGKNIPCNVVVITAGVSPNVEELKKSDIKINRGICVNRKFETSVPDVYACGDCAEIYPGDKGQESVVELLWYTGKMHGKVVAANILGQNKEYQRGIYYNSAKFFSIDYHTYGKVNQNIPEEKELYYEAPNAKKSVRIVYLANYVIGFSTLGVRFRHRVCERWIKEKKNLDYVLDHLGEANFDPEFFQNFDLEVKKFSKKKAS